MGTGKPRTYGDIADTVLPSLVFTLDTLKALEKSVDTYVRLAPGDRRTFFRNQMDDIWTEPIDWACMPRSPEFKTQWSVSVKGPAVSTLHLTEHPSDNQALRRYFQEQGRIRGPAALPERLSTRKWTGLRVCGVVYHESIDEMVFLGTGMRPGDTRGYIGQRMKCRTVFYWKLPGSERRQLDEMAKDWQAGSAPAQQKIDAYYRRFHTWIKNVHMTGLREFGQHLVTMAIPEPGLPNPPRLYEFMYDLKVLEKPLVKTVPVGDTLTDIYLAVNHAAGRLEGAALPTLLNKKSRLKRKTTWAMDETNFVGRDEIVLREEDFDEELFFKEAISMLYTIVRMAHSNISSHRDLDPPWASFSELVDQRYLLPDIPMCIPTALRQPNCFKYLKHWFTVTKGLRFNQWQRKNSIPMAPVPFDQRWWAASHAEYAAPAEAIPATAMEAMAYVPETAAPSDLHVFGGTVSPFGSGGGHLVHDAETWEQESLELLDIPYVPDPDDLQPRIVPGTDSTFAEGDIPPALVPGNCEARAQWCMKQVQTHCNGISRRVTRPLRAAIKQLAELPMVPNCTYPLKSAGRRCGLPYDLRWTMLDAVPPASANMQDWVRFLESAPWTFEQAGAATYAGSELAWTFVLGGVLYLRGYSAAGGDPSGDEGVGRFTMGCARFHRIFTQFVSTLEDYGERFRYPGWAPSTKYAVANSRSLYLAYLVRHDTQDVLLPLIKLITRLKQGALEAPFEFVPHSAATDAPSWVTQSNGVPSWQWQRCGLPPASHKLSDLPDILLAWLKRDDLLVDPEKGPRSCETGLAVMLKVALVFADLEHVEDENWTDAGARILELSTLCSRRRELQIAIADWANQEAVRLEPLLDALDIAREDQDEEESHTRGDSLQYGNSPGMKSVRRRPASQYIPDEVDDTFMAVDIGDVVLPHSVQEYRERVEAEPRTAVQELTRKGLQGISALGERRQRNKELLSGKTASAGASSMARRPAPQRTSGGWQGMPAPSMDDLEPQSDGEDTLPPRKRRRTMALKIRRNTGTREAATDASSSRTKLAKARGGKRKGTSGRRAKVNRSSKQRNPRTIRRTSPESSYESEDQADSMCGPVSGAGGGVSDLGGTSEGDDSDAMPMRITTPRDPRALGWAQPVTFDADATSIATGLDSDAADSAFSFHRPPVRRLTFIDANQAIRLGAESSRRSSLSAPGTPRAAMGDRLASSPIGTETPDGAMNAGGSSVSTAIVVRRSGRLKRSS
ncbi:unnamed protein product [Peniophora sp. CBMAI 1063]|nr:unnamed protein product [Peniophora sp. CBMAI 1063]